MRKPYVSVAVEGLPFIGLAAFAALFLALIDCTTGASLFFVLAVFAVNFFRDPDRVVPSEVHHPDAAVSPADGKVCKIGMMRDPITGETRTTICIFMNVFNVHVNRAPLSGTVSRIDYHPGRFFNASFDKASDENERCALALTDAGGKSWTVVQIAGLLARRIVCRAEVGDDLARGERFGLIRFGSRLDVYLPDGYAPRVGKGDKVLAGQSIIAGKDDA